MFSHLGNTIKHSLKLVIHQTLPHRKVSHSPTIKEYISLVFLSFKDIKLMY